MSTILRTRDLMEKVMSLKIHISENMFQAADAQLTQGWSFNGATGLVLGLLINR